MPYTYSLLFTFQPIIVFSTSNWGFFLHFRKFDKSDSGFVDRNELQALMKHVGDDDETQELIEEALQQADENGDGKIDYKGKED